MIGARTIRCAIYTRKSSEEGLEQDFNSLDAQHAACSAYILSQKHEGWRLVSQRYDDGGLSGGTLERPALQRLLADIEARRIDMVVIYKIDRLTRALTDFARLVERFDAANCSFVSVTQAFNTSTSMGRLTLNVLLSFAQFEREVTAERIRDKIAASKQKGLWMGGLVPLGYDAEGRTLKVNEAEAESVRRLFQLYLEHRCIRMVKVEADRLGILSKPRTFASGATRRGIPLSQGALHYLLTNPVYIGAIRHKDRVHQGQHTALIDRVVWDAVQGGLQENAARPRKASGSVTGPVPGHPSVLAGKLVDETGDRLTPSHAGKGIKRHRYYVSRRIITSTRGQEDRSAWRLPAEELEQTAAFAIARHLKQRHGETRLLSEPSPAVHQRINDATLKLIADLENRRMPCWRDLITQGRVAPGLLSLDLDGDVLARRLGIEVGMIASQTLKIEIPFGLRRRGVEARMVTGLEKPVADPVMCRAVAKALDWMDAVRAGSSIASIADAEGVTEGYIRARLPLALLSPGIVKAIEQGQHPVSLTTDQLVRATLPSDWEAQARTLGFAA